VHCVRSVVLVFLDVSVEKDECCQSCRLRESVLDFRFLYVSVDFLRENFPGD